MNVREDIKYNTQQYSNEVSSLILHRVFPVVEVETIQNIKKNIDN